MEPWEEDNDVHDDLRRGTMMNRRVECRYTRELFITHGLAKCARAPEAKVSEGNGNGRHLTEPPVQLVPADHRSNPPLYSLAELLGYTRTSRYAWAWLSTFPIVKVHLVTTFQREMSIPT